jgi:hypothetical protein
MICPKEYKLARSSERADLLRARFRPIFHRVKTRYATLDTLMRRLLHLEDRLLRVLDRLGIPLPTNASENDIRTFATKRKSPGELWATMDATHATSCSASPRPEPSSKIRSFDYLGVPSHSRAIDAQPCQASSAKLEAEGRRVSTSARSEAF